ncbi:MAG TPA: hypothetical protein VD793_02965, partial [Gemmatimonadales bacterium]|nr:hypothetical protein [Gemmatimonadales bacterium]
MTARERISRTRAVLAVCVGGAAILWGVAAAAGILAGFALLDWGVGLARAARESGRLLAAVGALAAVGWMLFRSRRVRSVEAVALWIEERHPALRFALVSAVDPVLAHHSARLEPLVAGHAWERDALRRGAGALARPGLVFAAALGLLAVAPAGVVRRVAAPAPGDFLARPDSAPDRLRDVVVTVTPPVHTGLRREVFERPVSVPAVEGSAVLVEGGGLPGGMRVTLDDQDQAVGSHGGGWRVELRAPPEPTVARLRDGGNERVLVLETWPDSTPSVTLELPARDTVFRARPDALSLAAHARDDFGLAELWFEFIISSGQGEAFRFRSGALGRVSGGGRSAAVHATLRLDSLEVGPGDVIHLRAVA